MLLLPQSITRFEQPQGAVRLDPSHPIGGQLQALYMPGVSCDNLAAQGAGGQMGSSAAAQSALPKGARSRLMTASNVGMTSGPAFRAATYPLTMIWAGRINSTAGSTTLANLSAGSMPGATYWLLAGGSSTQLQLGARNNFNTPIALTVNVPGGSALGIELVVVIQSLSATNHRIAVNGSAVASSSTNITALAVTYDRINLGSTSAANNIDQTLVGFSSTLALTDEQMRELTSSTENLWQMFEPQRIWLPMSSGAAPRTEVTSLGAAIQLARTATAGVSVAIQEAQASTSAMDGAVALAMSRQADLDAVIQEQVTATSSLAAAVRASDLRSAAVNAAVQAAELATAAASAAVVAQRDATVGLSTMVQTDHSAATSLSAMVQTGSSLAVSVAAAVQAEAQVAASLAGAVQQAQEHTTGMTGALQVARDAAATIDAVVQTLRSASVGMSAQVQDGINVSTALTVAIQHAQAAAASVSAAVLAAAQTTVGLNAAVALNRFLTLGLTGAVRYGRAAGTGLSANIFDPDAGAPPPPFTRRVVAGAARRVVAGTARRIVRA